MHAADAWGKDAAARCVQCHAPAESPESDIGCVMCHGAVGNRHTRDGELVLDLKAGLAGTDAISNAPHKTRDGDFLTNAALCGTCHEVSGPNLFVENTYSDFETSAAAERGEQCTDCHMTKRVSRAGYSHAFVGVEDAAAGTEDEQRALLERAILPEIEVENDVVYIRATNVTAAHSVPTGVAFFRDFWIDVTWTDVDGVVHTNERVMEFSSKAFADNVRVPLPTDADQIVSTSLGASETRSAQLAAPRIIHAELRLRAQAIRDDVREALDIDASLAPIIEISSEQIDVNR